MKLCVVSEYNCTFDKFEAVVGEKREEINTFISDFELVKVNDHKSIMLFNYTDMEAMQAFMTTPEMKQWDEENGCVDTVYSMEQIS
jgi:quinol monooxygenase YgiN